MLNCLADTSMQLSDYRSAMEYGERSAHIMREVRLHTTGEDVDRLYVQSLSTLGNCARARGDYAGADGCLREALAVAEATLGAEDPEVVTVLNGLGVLCKYAGRFEEGAGFYERAVRIAERISTPDDMLLATLIHNIEVWHMHGAILPRARRRRVGLWNFVSGRSVPITLRSRQIWRRWPPSSMPRGVIARRRRCTNAHSTRSSASTAEPL